MRTDSETVLPAHVIAWNRLLNGRQNSGDHSNRTLYITEANQKANHNFYDTMGDKPDSVTRLYFQNVNGLRIDTEGGDFSEVCYTANEIQADIICIAEHNLDTTKYHIKSVMEDQKRKICGQRARLTHASSTIQMSGNYKPGGTLQLSQGNITARLLTTGTDELGRWTYQTFAGKDTKPVTIITVYQVCQKSTRNQGQYTASSQQESLLRQRGEPDYTPRKAFRKDLKFQLKSFRDNNHQLIIVGDFNEVLGSDTSGMAQLCSDFDLIDLFEYHHGSDKIPTYSRGPNRLDYCLCTRQAADAITSCGYEPFCHRMFSDHRAFFLDFDSSKLFGSELATMPPLTTRDIRSNHPADVTVYIQELYRMMESRNVFARAQELFDSPLRNDNFAEILSRDMDQFRTAAAKHCSRTYAPKWSHAIATARSNVNILKRALFMCRTHYNTDEQIAILQAKAGSTILIPTTEGECQKSLQVAQQHLRAIVKQHRELRIAEQTARIQKHSIDPDPKSKRQCKIQKQMKRAEAIAEVFCKINYMKSTGQTSGVSHVEVPLDPTENPKAKTTTEWRSIDVPAEIESTLQHRNQKHFGQAHGTPFTIPPLSEMVDFSASTHTADLILDGTFTNENISDTTQLMISHLKRHAFGNDPPMTEFVTDADFVGKMKVWKEATSTSPSGFHLGHWKALCARHSHFNNDTAEARALDHQQTSVRSVVLLLINYALKWGYSYERWKTVVNVMIFKDPGEYKIHRLRVIHLYEADYNFILATKWRQLIHRASDNQTINQGQNGGVPKLTAQNPVFIEEMQNEISRTSRKPVVKFDHDATSCYDRIIAAIASITSRKFGMHKNVTFVMANTLQECKYKLKTALGVSKNFYQHCEIFPIYGTGQGSGNSPVIWCIISSVLFDSHASRAHGATYETPDRRHHIRITMIGFVDDSTGQVNLFDEDEPPNPTTLIELMRQDAQLWNDLLWASGGDLELPKCSYHYLHWQFTANGTPILAGNQVGPDLVLLSGNRQTHQTIEHKSAHTAHKTLGYRKDPAGNQKQQYDVLKDKSDKEGKFVACSALQRHEAWTHYTAIFLPSIGYSLPNCFFSYDELDKIGRTAMNAIFAKCGFNRKTKRAILYGPVSYGGARFHHLYTMQGVGQILSFLKHWRAPTTQPGIMLRIAVAWAQYNAGTSLSFLEDVHTRLPYCDSKWLIALQQFLAKIDGSFDLDDTYVLPIQREHDFYLMDKVLSEGTFSDDDLNMINYCRLYLQALTVSDITTLDGKTIDKPKLKGNWSLFSSRSTTHTVYQAKPNELAWGKWRKACKLWSTGGKLHQPLGRWLVSTQESRTKWAAYYSPSEDFFYRTVLDSDHYISYFLNPDNTIDMSTGETTHQIPHDAVPVSFLADSAGLTMTTLTVLHLPPKPPPPPPYFLDYLAHLSPWESELFHSIELKCNVYDLMSALQEYTFRSASDGSVIDLSYASFGWVLSVNRRRLVECSGPVYGYKPTSYRAEGYGLLSYLRFLHHAHLFTGLSIKGGVSGCDNISLVNNVNVTDEPPDDPLTKFGFDDSVDPETLLSAANFSNRTMVSDWDVLTMLTTTIEVLTFPITIKHVKGHQDKKKKYENLPILAQLNVDADRLAGQFQQLYGTPRPTVLRFPVNTVQLNLATKNTITYQLKSSLYFAASGPDLKEYIASRNGWEQEDMDTIDWKAHASAIARGAISKTHAVKLIHDILPTNYLVNKYEPHRSPKCPYCWAEKENRDHILRCPSEERQTHREQLFKHLTKALQIFHTDPQLCQILTDGLTAWFRHTTLQPIDYPEKYQRLIHQQNQLGWRQLFSGRLSRQWSKLQHAHLQHHALVTRRTTGHLWTVAVISSLWKSWLTMWEARNAKVHGHDISTRNKIRRERAIAEMEMYYANQNNMLPVDRNFFMDSATEHSQKPTHSLVNWLNTYRGLFKMSLKTAKKNAIQHTQSILHFFTRRRSAEPPG